MSRLALLRKFATSAKLVLDIEENTLDPRLYTDFKKHLKTSKVPYKDGPTCLHVECRMCCGAGKKAATAYVNKRTGIVLCPPCDIKKPLAEVFKAYEKRQPFDADKLNRNPYTFQLRETEIVTQEICDALRIKGLKLADLRDVDVRYSRAENALYFPLKNAVNAIVGEKVYSLDDGGETTYQHENNSGLLIHGTPQKQKAILVNSIKDFLVLLSQRTEQYAIVCLPYGLTTLPLESLPALETFKEIILWFKLDSTGWDAAKTFASKLDEKRCLLIRPTETEPSASECVSRGLYIRHVLQKAMPVRHKSITTFNALRNDILSELQNIEKVNGVKWKRFPVLNKLLKGHRKGELTIITGPTGSGKTTFMCEYSLDLALQGVTTLWGSFEIRNARLASTLLRQFVGYSLEKRLNEFNFWANEFEKYPLYFMTFHGQQPLKVVMEAIEHAHYVHDIDHVIIDNLQFMMGLSHSYRSDKFWEQDAIIAAFRALATTHNVHVTLVMHPRKERDEDDLTTSSIFGSAKASQEADNVLIIQDKRLTAVRGKKYLQIVKNRYSGDLGIMPLEFNKDSLSYGVEANKKKKEPTRKEEGKKEDCT